MDEIKLAYRAKAKLVHPDVNDSPKAHELFLIVNEAYDVLSDPQKRALHDVKLSYADKSKKNWARKEQNYTAQSKKAATDFSYNWANFQPKSKTDSDYHKQSPIIYNLFFICGMFLGFLILFIAAFGTINHLWPYPFVVIGIPGCILIVHGWKGIIGKRNIFSSLIKAFRKNSNKKTTR